MASRIFTILMQPLLVNQDDLSPLPVKNTCKFNQFALSLIHTVLFYPVGINFATRFLIGSCFPETCPGALNSDFYHAKEEEFLMKPRKYGRKLLTAVPLSIMLAWVPWNFAHATSIFINEIHYDNISTDTGEAIEIAGPAGTNLSGWSLALYNGNPTQLKVYSTISLSGIIPDQQNGFGTLSFFKSGIQNGDPGGDGIALVDAVTNVVQFLSYEGSFTAADGPAAGIFSTDIGVFEPFDTPVGSSLQLTGTGNVYADFSWASSMANTFGSVNSGQTFQPIPEPSTLLLLGTGLLVLWYWNRRWTNVGSV